MAILTDSLSDLLDPQFLQHHVTLYVGLSVTLMFTLSIRYLRSPRRRLPPGPLGLPFIGNAPRLKDGRWHLFSAMRKVYGAHLIPV